MTDALPTVLLTGFAPFGGEASNPSWDAVRALDGELVAGHRVIAVELPVVFGESLAVLCAALDRHAPVVTICVGLAGGRSRLSLERVAINVDDARIADNAGAQPVDVPVDRDGPPAHFTSLPIKTMLAALIDAGIPAEVSNTAGTYVCNHVFYGLMQALAARPGRRGGFIHIPYSPEQAARHPNAPSLPVALVSDALRRCIDVALKTTADLRLAAGAEH